MFFFSFLKKKRKEKKKVVVWPPSMEAWLLSGLQIRLDARGNLDKDKGGHTSNLIIFFF
jgi:hypothetical protein